MTTTRCPPGLADVRVRVFASLESLPDPGDTQQERMDRAIEICAAYLDAEFADYPDGLLQTYLEKLLELIEMEFGPRV